MSKSLGTGIDPLEEIDEHGADAIRFGLLAMSSSQDVKFYAAEASSRASDLANKLWNASRLILLGAGEASRRRARGRRPSRTAGSCRGSSARPSGVTAQLDGFQLSRAALELYDGVLGRGVRLVPRAREAAPAATRSPTRTTSRDGAARARALRCALLHPMMPFVTEEIWSHMPGRRAGCSRAGAWPVVDAALIDERGRGGRGPHDRGGHRAAPLPRGRRRAGGGVRSRRGSPPTATTTTAEQLARLARFELVADGERRRRRWRRSPMPGRGRARARPQRRSTPRRPQRRIEARSGTSCAAGDRAARGQARQREVRGAGARRGGRGGAREARRATGRARAELGA